MNCNGRVITILKITNRPVLIVFQVGLVEPLGMMHGWKNGVMLLWSMGIQVFLTIALCNCYYKKLNIM